MLQDLMNLHSTKSRYFRVFYPILEEDGCQISDLNQSDEIRFPTMGDFLLHDRSSYGAHGFLGPESSNSSYLTRTEIYKW